MSGTGRATWAATTPIWRMSSAPGANGSANRATSPTPFCAPSGQRKRDAPLCWNSSPVPRQPSPIATELLPDMTDEVLTQTEEGLAIVTLNRPERLNALTRTMLDGLLETLKAVTANPGIGCVVLTGAGRAFCSGGDVQVQARNAGKVKLDASPEQRADQLRAGMHAAQRRHEMPRPPIAKVHGVAAGAGMALALACGIQLGRRS